MSSEQYPQVGSDESGLVPPQNSDRAEWPKRLRSLTADELDRLTIDRDGRMYWDGKAVNFPEKAQAMTSGPAANIPAPAPTDEEREAIDMLDRAAADLAGEKPRESADASDKDTTPADETPADETPADTALAAEMASLTETTPPVESKPPVPAKTGTEVAPLPEARAVDVPQPRKFAERAAASERIRLKLSPMQSAAMVLVTVALFAAAFGIAANGFVAANEWGCRVGWITNYCPPERLHPGLSARIAD